MQITIESSETAPDDRPRVFFKAKLGAGRGVWCGLEPQVGEIYQIELDVLDPLDLGKNAELCSDDSFGLEVDDGTVVMTILVERVDPDQTAYLRLGADCLFLAEVAGSPLAAGQRIRLRIPSERLELSPYDKGPLTVIEN